MQTPAAQSAPVLQGLPMSLGGFCFEPDGVPPAASKAFCTSAANTSARVYTLWTSGPSHAGPPRETTPTIAPVDSSSAGPPESPEHVASPTRNSAGATSSTFTCSRTSFDPAVLPPVDFRP